MSVEKDRKIPVKCLTIVHGFRAESGNFDFGKKSIPGKSTSKGEQNGSKFQLYSTLR